MQFGQLLTHLDTTQQMIASSLKDNTTLLTQVCPVIGLLPSFFKHTDLILQLYLRVFSALAPLVASFVAGAWFESSYCFSVVVETYLAYELLVLPSGKLYLFQS